MLPAGASTTMGAMNNIFKQLGFRAVKQDQESGIAVIEKGLSPRWLSLIYHIALFICFIGFFITYLFAFEGEITLYPHQEEKIPEPSSKPRWGTIWAGPGLGLRQGIKKGPKGLELELEKFSTEYVQLAKPNYPKDFLSGREANIFS
jgi:cytochrome c biogenesis protein ResB